METIEDLVCKPCKKCGSTAYQNTSGEEFKELPDGRLSVTPKACDKCDFDLMLSESNELH